MGNLLGGLRAAIFGRKTEGFTHGPNDGIVHAYVKGKPDTFVKAFAERSAVAQALQKMGLNIVDPARHKQIVDDHARIAAWYAAHNPDSPMVKHYRQAAATLGAPDVEKHHWEKPKVGEFPEPENAHIHHTEPHIGVAGQDLADAATPLVRFVHRLWAAAHRQPAIDQAEPFVHSPQEPEPKPEPAPEPKPQEPPEVTPTIKPAADEPPLPLHDMRRKIATREPEEPVLSIADLDPLPLADAPHDEWHAIGMMQQAGQPRVAIVRALMKKYGFSPRQAAAKYTRYMKYNAKKLARRFWAAHVSLARKTDILSGKVDPRIAGTRLASHLNELAAHYADTNPRLAELAKRALYKSDKRPWDYTTDPTNPRAKEAGGEHWAELGEELKRYTDPHGMAVKGWRDPNEPAVRIGQAYNWHRMDKGLALDTSVKNFVMKRISGSDRVSERELFDRLERHLDLHPADKEKFFRTWFNERGAVFNGKDADKRRAAAMELVMDAVRRLADRAADREELQPNGPKGNTKWQDYFRWAQSNKHAKFDRKSDWISAKIEKIMKDGINGKKVSQDQAAAVAYHMWEKGHGKA